MLNKENSRLARLEEIAERLRSEGRDEYRLLGEGLRELLELRACCKQILSSLESLVPPVDPSPQTVETDDGPKKRSRARAPRKPAPPDPLVEVAPEPEKVSSSTKVEEPVAVLAPSIEESSGMESDARTSAKRTPRKKPLPSQTVLEATTPTSARAKSPKKRTRQKPVAVPLVVSEVAKEEVALGQAVAPELAAELLAEVETLVDRVDQHRPAHADEVVDLMLPEESLDEQTVGEDLESAEALLATSGMTLATDVRDKEAPAEATLDATSAVEYREASNDVSAEPGSEAALTDETNSLTPIDAAAPPANEAAIEQQSFVVVGEDVESSPPLEAAPSNEIGSELPVGDATLFPPVEPEASIPTLTTEAIEIEPGEPTASIEEMIAAEPSAEVQASSSTPTTDVIELPGATSPIKEARAVEPSVVAPAAKVTQTPTATQAEPEPEVASEVNAPAGLLPDAEALLLQLQAQYAQEAQEAAAAQVEEVAPGPSDRVSHLDTVVPATAATPPDEPEQIAVETTETDLGALLDTAVPAHDEPRLEATEPDLEALLDTAVPADEEPRLGEDVPDLADLPETAQPTIDGLPTEPDAELEPSVEEPLDEETSPEPNLRGEEPQQRQATPEVEGAAAALLPRRLAFLGLVAPVRLEENELVCLAGEPIDEQTLEAIERAVGRKLRPTPTSREEVVALLKIAYGEEDSAPDRQALQDAFSAPPAPKPNPFAALLSKFGRRG